jgi:hypothetical protein
MRGVLAALLAEFGEFQPVLESLFILTRKIIDLFTDRALHLDHVVLAHRKI